MNEPSWARIRAVFDAAIDLDGERRDQFVAHECAGDEDLLAEVRALLRADAGAPAPIVDGAPGGVFAPHDLVGSTFAGFLVVRRIGAGGMGTVYEAKQERQQRTVALKTLAAAFPSERARAASRTRPRSSRGCGIRRSRRCSLPATRSREVSTSRGSRWCWSRIRGRSTSGCASGSPASPGCWRCSRRCATRCTRRTSTASSTAI
jgi:hypothetical protein